MVNMESRYPQFTFTWIGGLVLLAGLFAGMMFISFLISFSKIFFGINIELKEWFLILSNAVVFLSSIAAFDFFIVRRTTGKKMNFNFSPTNFYTYVLIFPLMLGMMFIAEFVSAQIPVSGPFFGDLYEYFSKLMEQLTYDPLIMVITAVIMAPVFEEIIFRGIIQKGLINNGMKPWKAIVIASIIFGLVHGNPWQFTGAVLLGCVLGLVYYKTQSLLLPMLLHGFNNLCSTLLITYTKKESFSDAFNIPEWGLLIVGIAIFSLFYYLFIHRNKIHYTEI